MDMVNSGLKDKVKTLFANSNKPAIETAQVAEPVNEIPAEKPSRNKNAGFKGDAKFEDVK